MPHFYIRSPPTPKPLSAQSPPCSPAPKNPWHLSAPPSDRDLECQLTTATAHCTSSKETSELEPLSYSTEMSYLVATSNTGEQFVMVPMADMERTEKMVKMQEEIMGYMRFVITGLQRELKELVESDGLGGVRGGEGLGS